MRTLLLRDTILLCFLLFGILSGELNTHFFKIPHMFYRSQMISLKCKHLIQSVTGFLIISKSDRTKCHQILAINRITKLNITSIGR